MRLNNFNSTLQIALVLKSQEVEALGDDLWRRVSGTEAAICEDLGETVDPRNEFKFLKRLTRESIESSIMPCIPCVGLWMADLEEMWDGVEMPEKLDLHDISNKTIMEKSNIPWQVIRNIGHMAMSLRSVQSSCRSYRFQNLIEIQEYIMHRCQNLIEGQ